MKSALTYRGKPCPYGHDGTRYESNGCCVACRVMYVKEFARRHPERQKAIYRAYHQRHRDKILVQQAAYREANREKMKDMCRAYRQNNRSRYLAAKANRRHCERTGQLTVGLVDRLLILQRGRCAACGNKLIRYHLDHIEPIKRGGSNTDENIQLLCPPCNYSKGAKDPIAFMQLNGKLL